MELYNTLTRKVEKFVPNNEGIVKLYTCGPTVYHFAHIGNLRSYIQEDVLEKYLNYVGYKVERVMNITDVGHLTGDSDDGSDKMVNSAKKENKSVLDIAKFYTEKFSQEKKANKYTGTLEGMNVIFVHFSFYSTLLYRECVGCVTLLLQKVE